MINILCLPGDGIGPEVTRQAILILEAIAQKHELKIQIEYADFGGVAIDNHGNPFPKSTEEKCLNADAILLGAVGHPKFDSPDIKIRPEQGLLKLRKTLGVYLNIRPLKSFPSLYHLSPLKQDRIENVDFEIFRELTGGIYFGKRGRDPHGNTFDTCTYSTIEIERILIPAFEKARTRRKKLTVIDKANVLDTSRLWRKIAQNLGKKYPDIELDFLYIDNAAMQMILNPSQFDVIATSNMFGDIISDESSVIAGSIGLLPSSSIGKGVGLFEPIHGSYPQATGLNIANPIGTILSLAMMLDFLGHSVPAQEIRAAVQKSIEAGVVTVDISITKPSSCSEVGNFIRDKIIGT